jgi:Asp-tRNA(Asn)/Glu-tRNA(Gln) amidotransferase A subunit family amidase
MAMLNQLTLSELVAPLAQGKASSREVTHACLDHIQRVDGQLKALPTSLVLMASVTARESTGLIQLNYTPGREARVLAPK